ncbi:MAG: FAD binding domain-containing protein, partial [Sulfitobacter sp.]
RGQWPSGPSAQLRAADYERRPVMKPAPFDYVAATEMNEALEALHQGGSGARVIAGGQSLMPMLNMRLARPATLVVTVS